MKRSRLKNKASRSSKEEDKRLYNIQQNKVSKSNNKLKKICFKDIVGTPVIKRGGGRTFQKLSHLGGGGVLKILPERGDNPENGGGEGRGCYFFITLQFNCIYYILILQSFELTMQDCHSRLYST